MNFFFLFEVLVLLHASSISFQNSQNHAGIKNFFFIITCSCIPYRKIPNLTNLICGCSICVRVGESIPPDTLPGTSKYLIPSLVHLSEGGGIVGVPPPSIQGRPLRNARIAPPLSLRIFCLYFYDEAAMDVWLRFFFFTKRI